MTQRRWTPGLGVFAIGVALAGAVMAGGRAQEAPAPPLLPPPTLEEQVAELERRVADQQLEIERLARIAAGLGAGAERLAIAADQARALGFEWAGANPAARTELLEGMWAFHEALSRAAEPPEPGSARMR